MPKFPETAAALLIKERLYQEADGSRKETLNRFFEATDDIASGGAYQMAQQYEETFPQIDAKRFRVNGKVPADAIDKYTRMRELIEGEGSKWTGPRGEYVRGDQDLRTYLKERFPDNKQSRPGKIDRNVEAIINNIRDPADQSLLRQHMEEGLKAKERSRKAVSERNIAAEVFRNLTGLDYDEVSAKPNFDPKKSTNAGVAGEDRKTLQALFRRLTDNEFLQEFELEHKKGRVAQDSRPFSDLIFPEELQLIGKLCGLSSPT
jgi:hypothetical protein